MNKADFLNKFAAAAQTACNGTPIFPILAISEAAVESAWGESQLTKTANNLFGVKAYSDWKGETVVMHTKECHADGSPYYIDAAFKKYPDYAASFADYVQVVEGHRYAATGTENATTPEAQIIDIADGGYSTSKNYATLITEIIQELKPLYNVVR